jgi:hypothetical protein
MDDVVSVCLGGAHAAAIKSDGSLYMWGCNDYGILGTGVIYDSFTEKPVVDPVKILDNVVSVSLGDSHSAAVTADGSLYTWGANVNGEIGNGEKAEMFAPPNEQGIPTPVKVMDNVVSVSLGNCFSAAITNDGSLYTWGSNGMGQLGNGTKNDSLVPVKIMDDVMAVSLGRYHSAAITSDGSLYTWGENGNGQLGNGTKEDSLVPVKIMDNVKSIDLGMSHSAAITDDGSLYTWGMNDWGQVGNGTKEDCLVPAKILDNAVSVSLGYYHGAAITSDGSVYTWGHNGSGELGDGTTENSLVPIKITVEEYVR